MSALALPRNVAAMPSVRAIQGSLDRARSSARAARQEAKHAVNPMTATLATQGGAALHGLIRVYAGKHASTAFLVTGIGGIVAGVVTERPELVLAANGVLAPLVADQVEKMLIARAAG